MDVEMRYFKYYDADLIALSAAGYPMPVMMRDAVVAYANGRPLHYLIDEPITADFNVLKTMRTRLTFPDDDARVIYLLKHLKFRSRNMFCKAVLRNALIQQNLTVFFANGSEQILNPLKDINLSGRNLQGFANIIPISTLKGGTDTAKENIAPPVMPPLTPLPVPVMQSIPMPVASPVPNKLPDIIAPASTEGLSSAQANFIKKDTAEMMEKAFPKKQEKEPEIMPSVQNETANVPENAVQKTELEEEKPMFNVDENMDALMDAFDSL